MTWIAKACKHLTLVFVLLAVLAIAGCEGSDTREKVNDTDEELAGKKDLDRMEKMKKTINKAQQQQQAQYNHQQAELQQAQQERLQAERARNQALEQQAAADSPQNKIVKQTQSALTLLGFDVGVADGQLNQLTIEAIRAYQNSYNLLATGQPSEELLAHMRDNL